MKAATWKSIAAVCCLMAIVVAPAPVWAQGEASIAGNATDETGGALLEGMRDAFRKLLEQRYPGWLQLPEAELCQRLAHQSDLEPVRVFHALVDTPRKRAQFVTAVRDLQRLRETL